MRHGGKRGRLSIGGMIAIALVIVGTIAWNGAVIVRYAMYGGEGTAVIETVSRRRTPFTRRGSRQYRAEYAYRVNGADYEGTSRWISYNKFQPGQEYVIKFDPDDPSKAVLAVEKSSAESAIVAALIVGGTAALVVGLQSAKSKLRGSVKKKPGRDGA